MIAIAAGLAGRAETSKRNSVCRGWGWPFDRFERSTAISSKEDSIAEQGCGNKEGNVTGRRRWKQRRKTGRGGFRGGGWRHARRLYRLPSRCLGHERRGASGGRNREPPTESYSFRAASKSFRHHPSRAPTPVRVTESLILCLFSKNRGSRIP